MNMKAAGFTLIEILLYIAVFTLITGVSIPIYLSSQARNDFDITTVTIAQTLRRAQVLAQSVDGDTSWGVKIQSGSIIGFKGISYATRDTNFDEIFEIPGSLTPSGVQEVVFTKFTGLPQTTGSITLSSNTNETRNITVNTKGTVSY